MKDFNVDKDTILKISENMELIKLFLETKPDPWVLYSVAVLSRFEGFLRYLVNQGIPFDVSDPITGENLLHLAIRNSSRSIQFLLDLGIDPDHMDNSGETPNGLLGKNNTPSVMPELYTVIDKGDIEMVRQIVASQVNLNETDHTGATVLHYAVVMQNSDIVKELLKGSVVKRAMDRDGETSLHKAVRTGNVWIAGLLIDDDPALLSIPNLQGQIPIHIASLFGDKPMLEFLAQQRQFKVVFDRKGLTPLHYAIQSSNTDTFRFLLHLTLGDTTYDITNSSLLNYALEYKNIEFAKLLFNANVRIKGKPNMELFMRMDPREACGLLLDLKIPITPEFLKHLVDLNDIRNLGWLIDNNLNLIELGYSVLCHAITRGRYEIAENLLRKGVSPNEVRNNESATILAYLSGDDRLLDLLLGFGGIVPENIERRKNTIPVAVSAVSSEAPRMNFRERIASRKKNAEIPAVSEEEKPKSNYKLYLERLAARKAGN
jgi:ankyrin repeat protein